jgi:hypothetical protein
MAEPTEVVKLWLTPAAGEAYGPATGHFALERDEIASDVPSTRIIDDTGTDWNYKFPANEMLRKAQWQIHFNAISYVSNNKINWTLERWVWSGSAYVFNSTLKSGFPKNVPTTLTQLTWAPTFGPVTFFGGANGDLLVLHVYRTLGSTNLALWYGDDDDTDYDSRVEYFLMCWADRGRNILRGVGTGVGRGL